MAGSSSEQCSFYAVQTCNGGAAGRAACSKCSRRDAVHSECWVRYKAGLGASERAALGQQDGMLCRSCAIRRVLSGASGPAGGGPGAAGGRQPRAGGVSEEWSGGCEWKKGLMRTMED
eukprot:jgi/Tetstr1/422253/TSEL_013105.t1